MPRTTARFIGTDDLELAITIQMPLKHWKELRAQLPERWPACDLGQHIRKAVDQAEATFRVDDKAEA